MNFLTKSFVQTTSRFFGFYNALPSMLYIQKFPSYSTPFGCPCKQAKKIMNRERTCDPCNKCERDLVRITQPEYTSNPLEDPPKQPPRPRRYKLTDEFIAESKKVHKFNEKMNRKIKPTPGQKCTWNDLLGRNVAIAGGFGTIGKATAVSLLERNIASLGILDIRKNNNFLHALKTRYPKKNIYYYPVDVSKRSSVEEAFDVVDATAKDLDVFINGSGVLCDGCPEKTLGVNLLGTVYTTLIAMDRMGRHNGRKGGLIVNIASVLGLEPCNAFAIYSSSKHGQVGFVRSLADNFYYRRTGVKHMLVCPGITGQTLRKDPEGSTTFPFAALLGRQFVSAQTQSPEICGENVVRAIESSKNGSVWICDLGKYYEVKPVQYWVPLYENEYESDESSGRPSEKLS